jgi:hypothetical protein
MHAERPFILCFCLFLNFTLFASFAYAQPPAEHSTQQHADTASPPVPPVTSMESYIRTRLGADSRLYNGREYIRNGTPAKGFPNLEWDSLMPGFLVYDGISYNIPLEYDLAQDQLVIRNYTDNILIGLVTEKASRFSIGPYHFRYIGPGTAGIADPGFYQELFAGSKVTLLARKKKNLVFPTSADEQPQYFQINTYFLLLNGTGTRINNEKELLDLLSDRKEDLKKYIRKNHLSFKRRIEGSLIQTIAYYQQIKS